MEKKNKDIDNQDNIIKFNEISNNELKEIKDSDKERIVKIQSEYYSEFFRLLNSVDRPIVLRYDDKNNKLIVIKKEYMLNDVDSENFLDFKDYSHNSPFVITIIAGATISLAFVLYQASKEEKVNDEKAIENKSIEEKLDKVEEIILELASSSELNQTNEVENQYIKKELDNLKNTLNENIEN